MNQTEDNNMDRLKELSERLSSTEYELSQATALLAAIVQGADEAILTKNFYGIITSWNPAAALLYGYEPEEIIGQHISIIVPENKRDELDLIMKNVVLGVSTKVDTVRRRKDGRMIEVKLTVSPVRSMTGEIVGASSIAHPANWEWDDLNE
jgi:PAS domain S-box-containing protein